MRILLVEDDEPLARGLKKGLEQLGFSVDWVRDGHAAVQESGQASYAAILLDIGLPLVDGMSALENIRKNRVSTPVLMLTARDDIESRVRGLDLGADDYLVKPVDLRELAARLRAAIRRSQGHANSAIPIDRWSIDPATRTVKDGEQLVDLTPREFDVLYILALAKGRVVTRGQIESQMTSWGQTIESNAVEVHVHHLRKKLDSELIRTIRGVGYQLNTEN